MERKNYEGHPLNEKITRRAFLRRMVGLSDQEGGPSLLNTAGLSTAISLAITATFPVVAKIEESTRFRIGSSEQNRKDVERFIRDPKQLYFFTSLLAPIMEEPVFRIVPSLLLPKSLGTMWKVGIPSSALFAEVHALEMDSETKEVKLDPGTVPVFQFGIGLFLWKLVRERGYLHALIAHSIFNTVPITIFLPWILKNQNEPIMQPTSPVNQNPT